MSPTHPVSLKRKCLNCGKRYYEHVNEKCEDGKRYRRHPKRADVVAQSFNGEEIKLMYSLLKQQLVAREPHVITRSEAFRRVVAKFAKMNKRVREAKKP